MPTGELYVAAWPRLVDDAAGAQSAYQPTIKFDYGRNRHRAVLGDARRSNICRQSFYYRETVNPRRGLAYYIDTAAYVMAAEQLTNACVCRADRG